MTSPLGASRVAWALLLLAAFVFSDAWLGGRVFYQRDLLGYWYPHMEVVRHLAAEGTLPWWNPFVAFGTPLFADPNFQLAYPPTWLVLVIPPALYFKLYVVGHCWLAAVGTRGLVIRLGGAPAGAALAGAAYACSGPLLSSVSLFHHFAGAAWMPVVLWALVAAADGGTSAALRLGAAAAAQALAGSADLCVMTALAGLLLLGLGMPRHGLPWRALVRVLALSVPFAAALAAVQWLPSLALVADGARPALTKETSLFWSTHPLRLVEWFVPRLLSDLPLTSVARATLFESREPLLASLYLGVPASALAALGLAGGAGWGKRLGLGFAFFTLLALGRNTVVLPLLLGLPPFGLFRYPEKYMLPASLFFAILVARGTEACLGVWGPRERRRGAAVVVGALALSFGLLLLARRTPGGPPVLRSLVATMPAPPVGSAIEIALERLRLSGLGFLACGVLLLVRRHGRLAGLTTGTLGLLAVADLALAGRGVNRLAPAAILEHRPPVLSALRGEAGSFRVFSYQESQSWLNLNFTGAGRVEDPWAAWAVGNLDCLFPPSATRFGIRGSFDGDFSGLAQPGLYALGVILHRFEATALAPRLLRMANVGYVVSLRPEAFALPEVAALPSAFDAPLRLFQVPGPLPPVYVVDGVHVAGEPRSYEVMAAGSFDPTREAVVAEGIAPRGWTSDFRGEARLLARRADRVVVDARLSAPGILVLVEAWRRGWSVDVDGRPAPLLRANVLFRAVALPAGRHTVTFAYSPPLLPAGAGLSLTAALFGVLKLLQGRRPARPVEADDARALASGRQRGEGP